MALSQPTPSMGRRLGVPEGAADGLGAKEIAMKRTSPGLQALKRKQEREQMWADRQARIDARATKATLATAARNALRLLEIYEINLGESEERAAVVAELKATVNKPIWLRCHFLDCNPIPFQVTQADIDEADGWIECEYCGEACELVEA